MHIWKKFVVVFVQVGIARRQSHQDRHELEDVNAHRHRGHDLCQLVQETVHAGQVPCHRLLKIVAGDRKRSDARLCRRSGLIQPGQESLYHLVLLIASEETPVAHQDGQRAIRDRVEIRLLRIVWPQLDEWSQRSLDHAHAE